MLRLNKTSGGFGERAKRVAPRTSARNSRVVVYRGAIMVQGLALFGALFFTGLTAGVAVAVWIDYRPDGMSPSFYTEKMQHAIQVFTLPLPMVVIAAVGFTLLSTFLARHERPAMYLLAFASVSVIAVALITALGNIPINNQVMKWNIASPPGNWAELAQQWCRFQTVRTLFALAGLASLIGSTLVSKGGG